MGVDLHFIGTGISAGVSHNGFGGIVSNFVPSGSFPPAGSYVQTLYGVEYPVELGGEYFANPVTSENVPSQTCDVDELNDGSGGTYLDATSITNINYIPTATLFATDIGGIYTQTPVEVPSGTSTYFDSEFSYTYHYHDGSGSYYTETDHWQYYSNGAFIVEDYSGYQLEVPEGTGNYFATGKYNALVWNGSGGYTTGATNQGSFYSVGTHITDFGNDIEVPSGSSNFFYNGTGSAYYWNGLGGIGNIVGYGSYYEYGTFITTWYDGAIMEQVNAKWDGDGGYYTESA